MDWCSRLRERRQEVEKGPGDSLPKLTEPGFVSSVSNPEARFQNIRAVTSIANLDAIREKLATLAADELLPATIVHHLHSDHVAACAGCPDSTLRSYLRTLVQSERMDAGLVPLTYTVATRCPECGPVWLSETPHPEAKTCPWCFRRKAGKAISRPPVACGDCVHRLPDPLNSEGGMGGCGLAADRWHWPMQLHPCAEHQPIERGDKT